MNNKKYREWMRGYPKQCILYKEGCFYTAKEECAIIIHRILGYKLGVNGDYLITGGPKINVIEEKLNFNKVSYLVIECNKIISNKDFGEENNYNKFINGGTNTLQNKILAENTKNIYSNEEILEMINAFMVGVDSDTGELFEPESIIYDPRVSKILEIAKRTIEDKITKIMREPIFAGTLWTEEEDLRLVEEYKTGITYDEIARLHNRSLGAIKSRLDRYYPDR